MARKPSAQQMAAIVLAVADGYVRPVSPTHAHRCGTTPGRLGRTCQACVQAGWLRQISGGRYVATAAGNGLVPSAPIPAKEAWMF